MGRRRVKRLNMKERQGSDKVLIKFTKKLGRTQQDYENKHNELYADLTQLYNNRFSLMEPYFITIVACQAELQVQLANDLTHVLNNLNLDGVQQVREEIAGIVQQGGPSEEEVRSINGEEKGKGILGKLPFLRKNKNNDQLAVPGEQAFGGAMPVPPPKSPNGADESIPSPQMSHASTEYSDQSGGNGMNGHSPPTDMGQQQNYYDQDMQTWETKHEDQNGGLSASGAGVHSHYDINVAQAMEEEKVVIPEAFPDDQQELALDNGYSESAPFSNSSQEQCVAAYPYEGADDTDLSFQKGDIITVLEKIDPGWWRGSMEDGSVGLFPVTYVKMMDGSDPSMESADC